MKSNTNTISHISTKYEAFWVKNKIQNPNVSIIIPAYNVEKYIERCLASILKQTFKNYEVIIVNDGSNDKTVEISKEFSANDVRFTVLFQTRLGPSSARNRGLKVARGAYITFVDADDWISENYIESLYNSIVKNSCDVAVSCMIRKRKYFEKYRIYYKEEQVFENLQEKINICNIPKCCYGPGKLFKKSLVINSTFKEGVFFEDVLWLPNIIKSSNCIVTVPNCIYYYFVNNNSIVKTLKNRKKQVDLYNSKKFIIQFFDENSLKLSNKDRYITKFTDYFLGLPILKVKEYYNSEIVLLFGFLPIYKKSVGDDR